MEIEKYFKEIESEVKRSYEVAGKAREKGLDPVSKVETPVAMSLAEKAVGLISTVYPQLDSKIVDRILELEKQYGQLDSAVAFQIAEEIAREKFCKFESLMQGMDAGIRVGFSYITLGVVSSPIEGFTQIKTQKTKGGEDYIVAYFSGPIRSAGTTASCMVLMLIDYLREVFGFARYDPTDEEVRRYVTENYDYHERVTNLQYLPTEQEIVFLAKNLPIQISGEPTEDREVSNYKNLPRVESDFIRGGMCLCFSEGLAQKAQKGLRLWRGVQQKGLKATGWEFLDEYVTKYKKKSKGSGDNIPTYIKDLVAGRPVYSHPGRSGGFRFRYGRTRTSGFSANAVHPATMAITDSFLSFGTQLKIEKPTKGCVVSVSDEIDGPIIKLKNGSVKRLNDFEEAIKIYKDTEEILYLGDILVPFGDVANRNYELLKPGYVEEWWALELQKAGITDKIDKFNVSFEKAVEISKNYRIPLYPKYIYFWNEINRDEFFGLIDWVARGVVTDSKLLLPYPTHEKERFRIAKRALELIGCQHIVHLDHVIIENPDSKALLYNFGMIIDDKIEEGFNEISLKIKEFGSQGKGVLEMINLVSKAKIKDKSGVFIGARMGRPEKAKLRKLTGGPHVMFPVGEEGGRLRSVQAALEEGHVTADFPIFFCKQCNQDKIYSLCDVCGNFCEKMRYCRQCDKNYIGKCEEHGETQEFKELKIDIGKQFASAMKFIGISNNDLPPVIKGVRGTSNADHSCEHLGKGILRAKYNLNVNKDGTIRYDMTEMPITHFKPKEIGTKIERLKKLGYEKDFLGNDLENDNQIIELLPHDIILPSCATSGDERADDVFLNVARFIDDELERLYKLPKFFNASKKEDMIGAYFACIAPHICTASVGRLIGYSKTQGMLASPYMHAAMRRDCLGYNGYVSFKENGQWRISKIGELADSIVIDQKADNFGVLKKDLNHFETMSAKALRNINDITKHPKRKMLRVELEDGRTIELTEDHKIYLKGGVEVTAKKLKEGDKLSVGYTKDVDEIDIKDIFLPDLFKGRRDVSIRNIRDYISKFSKISRHDNFVFRDSFPIVFVEELLKKHGKNLHDLPKSAWISIKRDKVELPISIKLDEKLLNVIGLYIAEGHLRKNDSKKGFYQISIAGRKQVRDFVREVFYSHFNIEPSWENDDSITFSSRILYELFKDYFKCGENAHKKRIPSLFLNLKKDKIAALLRGYYEGDGSVSLGDIRVCCDSVSEGLKHDLSFVLSRFRIYTKYYGYKKEPGPKVREFYIKNNSKIPKFNITKIIIPSNFVSKFKRIGFLFERKNKILNKIDKSKPYGMKIDFDDNFAYPKIRKIIDIGEMESYCFNVEKEHNFYANELLVHNCDGDEAAVILFMDMLLNFSRKYLPAHRGGTQDAPLVLNIKIQAGDVDDQILDFESGPYSLELYELAEQGKHSSEVKNIEMIKTRLKTGKNPFVNIPYTHDVDDFNHTVLNSSYKSLPTMSEKVGKMMALCEKIRAIDLMDVARLMIERHFIRDTRGNLRKFSQQGFRCTTCNSKYRRPPLAGKCSKCGGRLIFTISEGSILKYMQPALELARKYKVSPYLLESLELTEMYIESIFGKEKEKQEALSKFF